MEKNTYFNLIKEKIDINYYYNLGLSPECGAVSMFSGITRNYFENKKVEKLSYSAYSDMVKLNKNTLGVIYETDDYKKIRFKRVAINK